MQISTICMRKKSPVVRTCCLFPFLVMRENAMVFGGVDVASGGDSSPATVASRWLRRIGRGTSNMGFRSNLRESKLSDIIFANSLSNSASASGSRSSCCLVTTISSSKSKPGLRLPLAVG